MEGKQCYVHQRHIPYTLYKCTNSAIHLDSSQGNVNIRSSKCLLYFHYWQVVSSMYNCLFLIFHNLIICPVVRLDVEIVFDLQIWKSEDFDYFLYLEGSWPYGSIVQFWCVFWLLCCAGTVDNPIDNPEDHIRENVHCPGVNWWKHVSLLPM